MPACSSRRTACAATSGVCSAGFAIDGVARRERRRHLAREDREREVPRADAGEHAPPVQRQLVALARRPGQAQRRAEIRPRARGVVAQEVHRLAHLGDAVGHRLAGFAHAHRDQLGQALFEQVRRLARAPWPRVLGRGCVPLAAGRARRSRWPRTTCVARRARARGRPRPTCSPGLRTVSVEPSNSRPAIDRPRQPGAARDLAPCDRRGSRSTAPSASCSPSELRRSGG